MTERARPAFERTARVFSACGLVFMSGRAVAADEPAQAKPTLPPLASWSQGTARPFAAGVLEVGALARGRAMLGYGKPHWTWGGAVLDGTTTTEFGAASLGARLALVLVDVTVAYRRTWAYARGFPSRAPSYSSADLGGSPKARYDSLDVGAWGLLPAPAGYLDWELEAHWHYFVPAGQDVYEEWVRVVTRADWTFATRLGYAVTFAQERGSAGVLGEWVALGGRGSVFRVGPVAAWEFSPFWDAGLILTTVVSSPDSLDFYDGLYGTLRLRYRFST